MSQRKPLDIPELSLEFDDDTTGVLYFQGEITQFFNFKKINKNFLLVQSDSIIGNQNIHMEIGDSILVFRNKIVVSNNKNVLLFEKQNY